MLPTILLFGLAVGVGAAVTGRRVVALWGLVIAVVYWVGLLLAVGDTESTDVWSLVGLGGLFAAANYLVGLGVGSGSVALVRWAAATMRDRSRPAERPGGEGVGP